MNYIILKRYILCVFLFSMISTNAQQKGIIISEDLVANAEELKVKMGTAWFGKIWKFKFGEYEVGKSKLGWTTTDSKSNLLNTKTESKSENKFSFVLLSQASEEAIVNAINKLVVNELQSFELFPNFYVGSDEILRDAQFFSALISTTGNPDDIWVLVMEETYGSGTDQKSEAFLKNKDRTVTIITTSSNKNNDDQRMFPALGYEFIENERSIGALQYFGGGAFGTNKNKIWLRNDLDPRTELILAAAMTAILQIKN